LIIRSAFLPPLYSDELPPLKTLRVGYPLTSCSPHSSVSAVQSTLASLIFSAFKAVAAFSYSGAIEKRNKKKKQKV
jgi:hypothetical protein